MRGHWIDVSDAEVAMLVEACEFHTNGVTETNIAIQTCWDSERQRSGSVGTIPNQKYRIQVLL
jgi:uncharacterized protein